MYGLKRLGQLLRKRVILVRTLLADVHVPFQTPSCATAFHLGGSCQPALCRAPFSPDFHSIVLPHCLCPLDLSGIALTLDIK